MTPTKRSSALGFHDSADVFKNHRDPTDPVRVIAEAHRIIYDTEEGYSVHVAPCEDGTVVIATVATAEGGVELCRRHYIHLDQGTVGLLGVVSSQAVRYANGAA